MITNRKPLKAIVLSFLCLLSVYVWAQAEVKPQMLERSKSITQQQDKEIAVIDNQSKLLVTPANSMCLLQAYSFHWFFIRVVSYHDTAYKPCDASLYLKLSPNSVIAQMRTLPNAPYFVNLPGIHFLTMDVAKSGLGFNYINIGSIRFFPIAISEVTLWDVITHPTRFLNKEISYGRAYTAVRTRENVYLRWNPGNSINYLTSPDGRVYVMTSFTSQLVPSLTRTNLSELGAFMNLPPGWTFSTKTLTKVLEVHSKQTQGMETKRLVDEYENIYIEVSRSEIGLK